MQIGQVVFSLLHTISNRLLEKAGFQVEGSIRDMYLFRDEYHDHYLMSILKGNTIIFVGEGLVSSRSTLHYY
ncbi:N-acetyltransferase [Fusibacter sp. A1]|nr:N-acetyltransferase [Fusibacter sp. A1]